jgi:hypothetical protein
VHSWHNQPYFVTHAAVCYACNTSLRTATAAGSDCSPDRGSQQTNVPRQQVARSNCKAHLQGNARKEGGDRFTVDIPGLPKHAVQLTDRGDGTYSLQFVPSHEGTASVHVMLDGTHVRGSPMAVSVHRDVDSLARGALSGARAIRLPL